MIPDYQTLMRPVLAWLAGGEVRPSKEATEAMADLFNLTAEERAELLASGTQRVIANRVGWAITYLAKAGLIERPARARLRITEAGQAALQKHPERIDNKVLSSYPAFVEFQKGSPKPHPTPDATSGEVQASNATPLEMVEEAVATNRAAVEAEVLQAALELSPGGFEVLVIRLLGRMGYGKSGNLVRTSASGDAGVDGIISQDPLGLDRIYVQAKRYAPTVPVDRPVIHAFAGALLAKQGDRGVLITTSRFTSGAKTEAEKINARMELIDGRRLAQLLVTHGVGVQEEASVTLFRLDEDYFENLG